MSKNKKNKHNVKIIPLGGLGEIGKNMMLLEIDNDIVIIDCGVMFPDSDMHGVDLVIPDLSYAFERKDDIKAVLLTHGHEDHIGALPFLLEEIKAPVYGSKLTIELVKARLEDSNKKFKNDLISTPPRKKIKLGGISFEFIRTNHSIADSYAIAIYTRIGTLIHTGDFKVDLTPVDGKNFDFYKFSSLGENGVLALFSDSTNVEREGFTLSEKQISLNLKRTIEEAKGRIIVATFSSNIHRLQQLIGIAKALDKKIAVSGRSMHKYVNIAVELGHFSLTKKHFIEIEDIDKYDRSKTMVIVTGSQGEPMSALTRLSHESHKQLKVEKDDTVVISASIVPGNEKMVSKVIDRLFKIGAHVIYEGFEDVHVSGHGSKQELKLMLSLIKPKFFVPVHGDFRHLVHHAAVAEEFGIHPDHIIIAQDGDIIDINNNEIKKEGKLNLETVYVDGKMVGDVGGRVLNDRQMMSADGIVIAIVPYIIKENKISEPDIITRGFVYIKESKEMLNNSQLLVKEKCQEYIKNNAIKNEDYSEIKTIVRNELRKYFYKITERDPLILVRFLSIK